MRLKLSYIISVVLATLLCACTTDEFTQFGGHQSGFYLSLGDAIADVAVTRSTPSQLGVPLQNDFQLSIVNDATQKVVYEGRFCQFVEAGNGTYTITAKYGSDVVIALDKPYYVGIAHATIDSQNLTPTVDIQCAVANALASVRYLDGDGNESTANFDDLFSDYGVQVWRGEQYVTLVNGKSAYFKSGETPRFVFVGTLRDINREITFNIESSQIPATMSAADHLILSLSLQPSTAGVILDVVKADVEKVTVNETIPLDWLPAPKMSAYDGESSFMRYEDEDAPTHLSYALTTATEVQDVELTINCTDSRLSALNGTHLLSEMTATDYQVLEDMGFDMPEIGATYNATAFNLNAFAANLRTNDGAITHNNVGIRVKANDRWTSSDPQTFDIEVRRLRLTLPTQEEGNAWSHTLYITPITAADIVAGEGVDVTEVLSSLYYEVSDDGGQTWTTITTTPEGDMLATTLNSGTTYQLRARYPATTLKSNAATQTMETPAEVPNGDFEDLRQTYSNVKLNAGGDYSVWPANYQNTATFSLSEPVGWASVNPKTCNTAASSQNTWYVNPSTYGTNISWSAYRSFGVNTQNNPEPYDGLTAQSGSTAMVMRNVGWDAEGPSISRSGGAFNTTYYNTNVPNVKHRSSGKLFLGTYAYSGGNNGTETYNEGTAFATRPTALIGYYKYVLDGDNNEHGTANIILLNGETVIAEGTLNLDARADYGQFIVPVNYTNTSLRPTQLRIMFTSSRYASYSQTDETAHVNAAVHNNTEESLMRGATLTIDNLTFIYDK